MSDSSTCSRSQTSTPQANLHTCEPSETSCQQMAESQTTKVRDVCFTQQDAFTLRAAAVNRRHSADGIMGSGSAVGRGPVDSDRFHPYRRQYGDGAATVASCLQQCPSSFSCLQEGFSPDPSSPGSSSEGPPPSWDQYNSSIQSTYPELPAAPVEPSCFLSQSYPSYSSSRPLPQVSSRLYSDNEPSNNSKYSLQSLATQSHQEVITQSLFPKPIYSYSILIFMALKSSKTGSLPVSEIYSFMTEHFPYFKTAPDGWKNSVRHNLSLNKCFEKVENRIGNSSRKGCLWALNPAKVVKMQEELHKWRRKDPITVRRSMAKPDDLDRLVGERPDKLRSLPPYTSSSLLSRGTPSYSTSSSSCSSFQLRPPCQPVRRQHYNHILPQQAHYIPPTTAYPGSSFALCSPCGQQPTARGLNSSQTGKMPPVYNPALQADYSVGPRSMQDLLLEGDASYDIDTFNTCLTDLQLQGHLWEELREDTLVSDPQVTAAVLSTPPVLQEPHIPAGCLQVMLPVGQTSQVTAVGRCKAEYEDEDAGGGQSFEQHGLHPVAYSGVENMAGYLTSCTTSISLM